ncbi:MAG: CHASE2 domain-containing protein [Armatimonadetes bacterium]|nr:CHASE2 domain-containing protein [Armatimonadota bacterium]
MIEYRSTLAQRAILLALALLFTGLLYRLALNARDWGPELGATNTLYKLRGPRPVRNDFLVVSIQDDLLNDQGRGNRIVLANLIRRLKAEDAKAIVLDIYMPQRTEKAADAALWRAIARSPQNVFLPAEYNPRRGNVLTRDDARALNFLEESVLTGGIYAYGPPPKEYVWWKFVPPVSDFTQSAAGRAGGVGVALNEPDPDRVVRRTRMTYQTDIVYPPGTVATRLIKQGNVTNVAVPNLILPVAGFVTEINKRNMIVNYGRSINFAGNLNPPIQIPVDRAGRMLINYAGPVGSYPTVLARDVLNGEVEGTQVEGKIVFVGIGEGALADAYNTPFGPQPRVHITANGVATVLDRAFLTQSVEDALVPLGFLALFLALTFPFFTALGATLWMVLCLIGYGIIAWFAMRSGYGILPLIPALLMILLMWLSALALRPLARPRHVVY